METKNAVGYTLKASEPEGIVEAIVSVFGHVDSGGDRLRPGAFAKTLRERAGKIKILDQHAQDSVLRVVGKPLELREMAKAELPAKLLERFPDSTGGLYACIQFLMDTPEGAGVFKRIRAGAVTEWSFGFDPLDVDFTQETVNGKSVMVRNIRAIRLFEVSAVLWGMQEATATLTAKGVLTVREPRDLELQIQAGLLGCEILETDLIFKELMMLEQQNRELRRLLQ